MDRLFETTILISGILLGVLVPFFVFSTTLLGAASKRLKEEEERAKEKDKKEFDEAIVNMEGQLKKSQESGDIAELKIKLNELIENRKKSEGHIQAIRSKYESVMFRGVVAYTGAWILAGGILSTGASVYLSESAHLSLSLWIAGLICLGIGIGRLCIALARIQDIAVAADEHRLREQARSFEEAFSRTLEKHEQSKQAKLKIKFTDVEFPLDCQPDTELKLYFRVYLIQGKIVRNVDVWFFVQDGFELISPDAFWRQAKDAFVPNIRTVKVRLGDVSIGPYIGNQLQVKAPKEPGEYTIYYSLRGDEYNDKIEELLLRVGLPKNSK